MVTKIPKPNAGKSERQLTLQERTAVLRCVAAPRTPRVKLHENRTSLDHPDEDVGHALLMEALGTMDIDFLIGLLKQLADAGRENDEDGLNFMLSVVKGVKPRDQVEAMLAAQMAAVHKATMTCAGRFADTTNIANSDIAERALTRLTRTFAAQVEALKRYRTGGEQNVTVGQVSVNDGGQTIVGNVTQAAPPIVPEEAEGAVKPANDDSQKPALAVVGDPAAPRVRVRPRIRE